MTLSNSQRVPAPVTAFCSGAYFLIWNIFLRVFSLRQGAAHLGFVFTRRKPAECAIEIFGEPRIYQILNVIDFTSARKRMSIVVRAPDGRILIMCKVNDYTQRTSIR